MPKLAHGGLGLLLAAGLAALVVGCGGGGLGFESPPTGLDPNSPKLVADNIAFDRSDLDIPANTPFILVFENAEGVGHNVSIYSDAGYQTRLFEGVVFSGPATRWYPVPALGVGTWVFRCDLHPEMTGRLHAS